MTAIHETNNLGDLLKYEEGSLRFSREIVTVAAGQKLSLGCVVAKEDATGKIKQLDPAATDGTQVPVGILIQDVDASLMDIEECLLLTRHAVVASSVVIWPEAITDAQKAQATQELSSLGILVRQSA